MSVSVIVGTYGDSSWVSKAKEAMESADNQTVKPLEVIHFHDKHNLCNARNSGAEMASGDWLIFLDADDALDSRYIEEMLSDVDDSTLRQPSTLGVYPDGSEDDEPVLIPERSLLKSNYLVIGTMCLRSEFMAVGGFDPELPVLEDWDLWIRMWKNGSKIGARPEAIYRVGVNPNSRNSNSGLHGRYFNKIRRKYV